MVKYPVGIQSFEKLRTSGFLYVDKTRLMYDAAQNNFVFLSRPRRFGKSLLTSTFKAYFSRQKELFKGLEVEQLETEWKQYPVLHFSLASEKRGAIENLDTIISMQLDWAEKENDVSTDKTNITTRMTSLVKNISHDDHRGQIEDGRQRRRRIEADRRPRLRYPLRGRRPQDREGWH